MNVALDHLGFPLIYVEEVGAWLTLLPVTKIQYEYYLCDRQADRRLTNKWYGERLSENPRTTAHKLTASNFYNAFMTSVTAEEANWYISWMFDRLTSKSSSIVGCRLPTDDEWKLAFRGMRERQAIEIEEFPAMNSRAQDILQRFQIFARQPQAVATSVHLRGEATQGRAYTMSDQMLLRRGVYEWVSLANGYGGRGAPPSSIGGLNMDPASGPTINVATGARHPYFGFRVLVEGDL